jgi:D-citramalate synthase
VSLSTQNKVIIAHKLDNLGVDIIEAGSAITSKGEREAIHAVAKEGLNAEICSYCRVRKEDINYALECEVDSIHLVVPVSDLHIKTKLKKDRETVRQMAIDTVQYARDHGLIVELSGEDASRADMVFLKSLYSDGIEAGADRLAFCDTVGLLVPETAYDIFKELSTLQKPLAVHCHNDFGLAAANTLSALRGGASEAHVTINGIGERAGNTSLEEVVMALETIYDYKTRIVCKDLYTTSRLVSRLTGLLVSPNKAIVGGNAFTHEASIHAHGLLADTSTYEPIKPESVGQKRKIVLGKHAGKSSVRLALKELDRDVTNKQLDEILRKVKELGDKGKYVTDTDLKTLVETVLNITPKPKVILKELIVVSGYKVTPTASVKLKVNGDEIIEAATGDGPMDAAITAIKKGIASVADIRLNEYHVDAISGGTDALVEVQVKLSLEGEIISAQGADTDIIIASVEAVIEGINHLIK